MMRTTGRIEGFAAAFSVQFRGFYPGRIGTRHITPCASQSGALAKPDKPHPAGECAGTPLLLNPSACVQGIAQARGQHQHGVNAPGMPAFGPGHRSPQTGVQTPRWGVSTATGRGGPAGQPGPTRLRVGRRPRNQACGSTGARLKRRRQMAVTTVPATMATT